MIVVKDRCPRLFRCPLLVRDEPRFLHRGYLLDTAHHFKPVQFLERAMLFASSFKLNVFHWHLTDHQAFGLRLYTHTSLADKSAPAPHLAYTPADVRRLMRFAASLGVTLLPEIDVPGHALGWEPAYPQLVTTRCKDASGPREFPNCKANLHPTKERTYAVVKDVVREVVQLFPVGQPGSSAMLHLGGDEVDYKCWRTPQLERDLEELPERAPQWAPTNAKEDTAHQLLEYFERRLKLVLSPFRRTVIRWEEGFKLNLAACCLPTKTTVIQFWRRPGTIPPGRSLHDATRMGYRVLVASESHWYLDPHHMFRQPWTARYLFDPLRVHYYHKRPARLPKDLHHLVLGGEAACWGRCMATDDSFEQNVWLPLMVIAERLWTEEASIDVASMRRRLPPLMERMRQRGYNIPPLSKFN